LKIIITGGEGFIGTSVANRLVNLDYEITSIDKRQRDNYHKDKSFIKYEKRDITDYKSIKDHINSADGIIHLAAVSRVIWGEIYPQDCIDINIKGTLNIVEAAKKSNKKPWIILGSSREVYGETNGDAIGENYSINPINTYGTSKYAAEQLVKQYSSQYKTKSVALRFLNVYGDLTDILDRVTPKFIMNALLNQPLNIHGGQQIVDFTHISDTTTGIIKTIEMIHNSENNFTYDSFHLLPGKSNSLSNLVEYIKPYVEKEIITKVTEKRNYDVDRFVGDPSKAEEFLDFKCKISFKEGVKKTVQLYKEELKNNREKLLFKFEEDKKCELP